MTDNPMLDDLSRDYLDAGRLDDQTMFELHQKKLVLGHELEGVLPDNDTQVSQAESNSTSGAKSITTERPDDWAL